MKGLEKRSLDSIAEKRGDPMLKANLARLAVIGAWCVEGKSVG